MQTDRISAMYRHLLPATGFIAACLGGPAAATTLPNDVMFMIDGSGSLGTAGFAAQIDLVTEQIGQRIDPTATGNRVGLIQFSTTATTVLDFDDAAAYSTASAMTAADSMAYASGWTATWEALSSTLAAFDAVTDRSRERRAVLITDGVPCIFMDCPADVSSFKSSFDDARIELSVIMSGSYADPSRMEPLVDEPAQDIYALSGFSDADADRLFPAVAPVPLPAGLVLLISGLGGFALMRRRAVKVMA